MADTTGSTSNGRFSPRTWIGLALATLALAFIFQNREPVSIHLLMFTLKSAHWVALLGVFGAGVATGWLISRRKP